LISNLLDQKFVDPGSGSDFMHIGEYDGTFSKNDVISLVRKHYSALGLDLG